MALFLEHLSFSEYILLICCALMSWNVHSQSLHNLGLTHELCLRGGSTEDQQCTSEMAEYQYEAAWRCSMWENMEERWVKGCHGYKMVVLPFIIESCEIQGCCVCVCVFPDSSLQVAGSEGGYHQSVYSCLTALKDGESNLLQSSLVDARWVLDHMGDSQWNERFFFQHHD